MSDRSTTDFDTDPTDELPVLPARHRAPFEAKTAAAAADESGEHTGEFVTVERSVENTTKLPTSSAPLTIAALEADVERLVKRCEAAERMGAEQARALAEIENAQARNKDLIAQHQAAGQRLLTELRAREAEIQAGAAEIAKLAATAAAMERALLAVRSRATGAGDGANVQSLLEDYEALTHYVDGRREHWEQAQHLISKLGAKVAALEHALGENSRRRDKAETLAVRESQRAAEYRSLAVLLARRLRDLEEIERMAGAGAQKGASGRQTIATPLLAPAIPSGSRAPARTDDSFEPRSTASSTGDLGQEPSEAVAQLEAELAYRRQQVGAQLVELREREARLQSMQEDLDQSRRETDAARTEIATLRERMEHSGTRVEVDHRPDTMAVASAEHAARQSAPPTTRATLVRIAGTGPTRFALQPGIVTIGRAPHCHIQLDTHFVSREHARISIGDTGTTIEDLGSRNGVYVNTVKITCQQLRHGDVIGVGEAQFRYLESVAH